MRVVWSNCILMTLLWLLWEWNGKSVKEKWVVQLGDYSILWMGNKVIHTRMGRVEMETSESIWYIQSEPTGLVDRIGYERWRRKLSRMTSRFPSRATWLMAVAFTASDESRGEADWLERQEFSLTDFQRSSCKPKLNKTFIACNFLNSSEKVIGNSIFKILHLERGREGRRETGERRRERLFPYGQDGK